MAVAFQFAGTVPGNAGACFFGVAHPLRSRITVSPIPTVTLKGGFIMLFGAECDHRIKQGSLAGGPESEEDTGNECGVEGE